MEALGSFCAQSQRGGQADDSAADDCDAHSMSITRISTAYGATMTDLIHLSLPT